MSQARPPDWFSRILVSGAVARLGDFVARGGPVSVRGSVGSSTVFLAAALQRRTSRPILLITAHIDDADDAADSLQSLGLEAVRFPAIEVLPGESSVNLELVAERLTLVERLHESRAPSLIVLPIAALMQTVPSPERLSSMLRVLSVGDQLDSQALATWLANSGYSRVAAVDSPGEFAVRGGIIDVFPPGSTPTRIDLFGDKIESLHEIDLATMGSDRRVERVELVGATLQMLQDDEGATTLPACLPRDTIAVLAETLEIAEQGRGYFDRAVDARGVLAPAAAIRSVNEHCAAVLEVNQYSAGAEDQQVIELDLESLPTFAEDASEAVADLVELSGRCEVVVLCLNDGEAQRMRELLDELAPKASIEVLVHDLHRGFIWEAHSPPAGSRPLALVPYHELLHRTLTRRRSRRTATGRALDVFTDLQPGDYVVHRDHGIGRFVSLQNMAVEGAGSEQEFLTIEFAGRTRIHTPASQIDLVQKYVGALHGKPELSTVGGKSWARQKEKVAEAVRDLAAEMLRIQAAREAMPGIRFPADTPWQKEFEAEFPYEETEDQLVALAAIKKDMASGRPMDRLVCGDVGFGKTELAIRAAFKAAEFGKQVAVLVPTTVLAEQHERTFRQRFADYPFRVESISRFKTAGKQREVLENLRKGQVDIIIGTHRLLSKDVHFADLGLVVIDEEQRFGVEHKHRLLEFRMTADVLTLSATPIPRTLHMALLGLRDISSLTTPPADRRAIVTEVVGYNRHRIKQAIQRELAREGQVYFVHNRVYNIKSVADDVRRLVPDARIVIGHGQMAAHELEKVMLTFMRRQADILVCTTIIESGIDIPTANTMFINNANMFGLSELHQLRGRVGRYKNRAYCYMLLPDDRVLSDVALKRLRAIESFSMLGAGFKIALRDLEIRGAGNLLGAEQSGHIAVVGYEMYCQLLERAVNDLKNEQPVTTIDTVIDIGINGALPKGYIPSDTRRMEAYRRLSRAVSLDELRQIEQDLVSAYGDLPRAADLLVQLAGLRLAAAGLGIGSITRHEDDVIIRTERPAELDQAMRGAQGTLRLVGEPDDSNLSTMYYRPPKGYLEPTSLLAVLRKRLAGSSISKPEAGSTPVNTARPSISR